MHHYARKYTITMPGKQTQGNWLFHGPELYSSKDLSFLTQLRVGIHSPQKFYHALLCLCLESHCKHSYVQSGFLCYFVFIFGYILELANSYSGMPLYMSYRNCYRQKTKQKTFDTMHYYYYYGRVPKPGYETRSKESKSTTSRLGPY